MTELQSERDWIRPMNRRGVLFCLGFLAIVIALSIYLIKDPEPGPRLLVENFPSIRNGMSQAEVETLLGGPPGYYGQYPGGTGRMTAEGVISPPGSVERIWHDDSNRFEIYFDSGGFVVTAHKRAGYGQGPPEGIIRKIRRKIGI
jgi:hypothetical protein